MGRKQPPKDFSLFLESLRYPVGKLLARFGDYKGVAFTDQCGQTTEPSMSLTTGLGSTHGLYTSPELYHYPTPKHLRPLALSHWQTFHAGYDLGKACRRTLSSGHPRSGSMTSPSFWMGSFADHCETRIFYATRETL